MRESSFFIFLQHSCLFKEFKRFLLLRAGIEQGFFSSPLSLRLEGGVGVGGAAGGSSNPAELQRDGHAQGAHFTSTLQSDSSDPVSGLVCSGTFTFEELSGGSENPPPRFS